MKQIDIFVYGTLKPGEKNYQFYCEGRVIQKTPAYTWGNLYNLPLGYPAMTEGNNKIEGYLLTFDDPKILASLDELEDYHPEREAASNEYYRQQVRVYSLTDDFLGLAWSYLMSLEKIRQLKGIPLDISCWNSQLVIYNY